ncbi:acyl-CoA dehydrogenase family member 10-like [Alosa sapidissima]|uniref:acyl-CoA dehydrogenase family member 10-like n=1 Tax=Alosa sapidissima TaxID=34773 RepID=UPI001C089C9C|nr:acyl-CoA dehydrogenase family member 10-like [Alosa sapidissima]XP_041926192.1 acyl-CoA dehydrogenase family member 10-like [Alosa sapidissima]XP_041926193.1 acyl-CoA dehydrogenase family member 10-like [Alosa sapidissima]XP_041926194.1 acyl-CoA dehydrogenase family member 10-like [Alosa sapidissima]XP_041926195.1 acyl-CoA dehydrogenase family member 10-like [Alosa sapidissima]XP_041926196.1 acyl-CoA dehydrogenase family member 10-like [Alosa sapidissima]XP_041926197.1 acyl-CoA dehydrogena
MLRSRRVVRLCAVTWHSHLRHLSSQPYKAVIFDMYGVLIPSPMPKAKEWEERNGVPPGTIGQAVRMGGEASIWKRFMRGELGVEEFLKAFNKECSTIAGCAVCMDSFLEALTSGGMRQPLPGMMEAVENIRASGLKTAVLSNNFLLPDGGSYLPLDQRMFNVIVESCRVGLCKPDPRIYELCVNRLGVSPQETVFLDDLPVNVEAATKMGMRGIQVADPAVAIRELEELLQFSLSDSVPGAYLIKKHQLPMDQLTRYLRDCGFLLDPVTVQKISHSSSQHTYLLNSRGRKMVLKMLPHMQAAQREQRTLTALKGSRVPVPDVLKLCEDASVLGSPFLLLEPRGSRVLQNPSLPDLKPEERRAVYGAVIQTLCHIHSLEPNSANLDTCERVGQLVTMLTEQYRASARPTIPAMERLMEWLPAHLPTEQPAKVVHGDFRLSSLVFDVEKPQVAAVLGWDRCALGDPLMDLASLCTAHYLPPDSPIQPGLARGDLAQTGIPDAAEVFQQYSHAMGLGGTPHWRVYMALSFFRLAVHLQVGSTDVGTGERPTGHVDRRHELITQVAELAWDFATKEGFRVFNAMPRANSSLGT